jgi:putative endonuclease
MHSPPHQLGHWGESFAAGYLSRQGFKILRENWRGPFAEVDLVAESKTHIVFCEVKTRTSDSFGHPSEAVDGVRIKRLQNAITGWPNPDSKTLRIDVIAISLYPKLKIEHFEGVEA